MRQTAGGALCVFVLATSCGGGGELVAPEPVVSSTTVTTTATSTTTTEAPTTTSTTTTIAEPTDEDQILALVERYWDVVLEANNPPNPDHPGWAEVAGGNLLNSLREKAARALAAGEGLRAASAEPSVVEGRVVDISEGLAIIEVCLRDDWILFELSSGLVLNDEAVFVHFQHLAEDQPAGWRVVEAIRISNFDNETACIESF